MARKHASRFYRGVLQKKTPLLGLTVLQLLILWLVIIGGVAAFVITRQQSPQDPPSEGSNQSGYNTNGTTNAQTDNLNQQQQSGTQPNTSSGNQSDCKREVIPYKTTYQNVSYLQKGQTSEAGGHNGSSLDCGDGNPIILKPVDKTVYVGTGLTDAEIEQQRVAAQQEYDRQYMQWVQTRNNAYQSCMNSLPSSYPSRESYCTNYASQQAGPPPKQP